MLLNSASKIEVLVGPQSGGKTWLLRHLLVYHPELVGRPGHPALFINGRRQQLASAARLTSAFWRSSLDWAEQTGRTASEALKRIESFTYEASEPGGAPLGRMLNLGAPFYHAYFWVFGCCCSSVKHNNIM